MILQVFFTNQKQPLLEKFPAVVKISGKTDFVDRLLKTLTNTCFAQGTGKLHDVINCHTLVAHAPKIFFYIFMNGVCIVNPQRFFGIKNTVQRKVPIGIVLRDVFSAFYRQKSRNFSFHGKQSLFCFRHIFGLAFSIGRFMKFPEDNVFWLFFFIPVIFHIMNSVICFVFLKRTSNT